MNNRVGDSNIVTAGQQFQLYNNMQLKETCFFDVWTGKWVRKCLSTLCLKKRTNFKSV